MMGRVFMILLFWFLMWCVSALDDKKCSAESVVMKEARRPLVCTEFGEISAVNVSDGRRGSYHLQFITMEPNALFLPVLLHADMVFYVHSGSGRLSWIEEDGDKDEITPLNLQRGDVYRLNQGTVFFIQSNLETERQKLRIFSIFATSNEDLREPSSGPYSSISDLLLGFDTKILQAAFNVPEEIIKEIAKGTRQPLIVHGVPKSVRTFWELNTRFMKALIGSKGYYMFDINKKKDKKRGFNLLTGERDVENCNGWSSTVTRKKLKALKDIGIFMVNLTKGSMMGPHWNPTATEIAIVVQGQGMVRVVCSSSADERECENRRFRVKEGDVFAVPKFNPMAQISFNNDTFVFMGFTTTSKRNQPQFLAGKSSVFQTLEKHVLAASFNVPNTTIDHLLAPQNESIILECTSCAEEEEMIMEEEIKKRREEEEARKREEEKRREEEEARKREEEEEAKRREEEEARKREEEEEARKREEEKRREEEEARKREEEEEAKRREEEEARKEEKRREEEEARKREEEEAKRREEEEARKREEEEEARKREEEKRREEEEARKREEEEEAKRREEEEARKREEEEARKREEEEEATRKREEEEEARKREEEEEAARKREEEEEAARKREEEEEARKREEEEIQQEEERKRQEAASKEEEAARKQEEKMEREQGKGRREVEKQKEKEGTKKEEGGGEEGREREQEERRQRSRKEEEGSSKREEERRGTRVFIKLRKV